MWARLSRFYFCPKLKSLALRYVLTLISWGALLQLWQSPPIFSDLITIITFNWDNTIQSIAFDWPLVHQLVLSVQQLLEFLYFSQIIILVSLFLLKYSLMLVPLLSLRASQLVQILFTKLDLENIRQFLIAHVHHHLCTAFTWSRSILNYIRRPLSLVLFDLFHFFFRQFIGHWKDPLHHTSERSFNNRVLFNFSLFFLHL